MKYKSITFDKIYELYFTIRTLFVALRTDNPEVVTGSKVPTRHVSFGGESQRVAT